MEYFGRKCHAYIPLNISFTVVEAVEIITTYLDKLMILALFSLLLFA
jgi:hypothetical protein